MVGKRRRFLLAVLQSLGLAVACNISIATNAAATEAQQLSCPDKLCTAVHDGRSIVDINGHTRIFARYDRQDRIATPWETGRALRGQMR